MNRRRSDLPPDATDDATREALLRQKFIDPEAPASLTPRDCVRQIPLANDMVQLLAWDADGQPGPFLVMPADKVKQSHVDWLLALCRELNPPRTGHLRVLA